MPAIEQLLELPFARPNEPLSRHTTIRVGGPARVWVEPNSEAELVAFLELNQKVGAPLYVLGAGSNVVPSQSGWDGAILHLGKEFAWRRVENGNLLVAGGAALLPKLTHFARQNLLGNFEWACGVPGSIGGSLWGNAGARGWNGHDFESRDCAADFHSCVAFDRTGIRHELKRGDVEFAYRKSSLGEFVVTEATFQLEPLSSEEANKRREIIQTLLERRRATQPANAASAGCIWKNPPNTRGAGALVEELGLKGQTFGGARVSELHGNFVINAEKADARDVEELVSQIEREVRERTGIELEREARFI